MVSWATSTQMQGGGGGGGQKYMADTRLFNEHFYKIFVRISVITWQKMPLFNFPLYKSMENLSCPCNQPKEPNFIKKRELTIP